MVLSLANKEQNQHYPPSVYEAHYSIATHWLIDECAKRYPGTQSIMDLIAPYMDKKIMQVKNGVISFPENYRHLLGYGVYHKNYAIPCEWKAEIGDELTEEKVKTLIAADQVESKSLTRVSVDRWNSLTSHRYKKPKLDKGIACIFSGEGIKVCPFEIPFVEVRFIVKTTPFKFGYSMNPDDTYFFDAAKTEEAKWNENAIEYLFKAINILYGIYVKDPEHSVTAKDLRDVGLF